MMAGQQPIILLKEGTQREKGKDAQSNNIIAAVAVSDVVKSTLGPKGMDKMLVDSTGDIIITNDGATILKEIDVEHPAAKMMVNVAKSQDKECGDGTTTAVILTGELLKSAEKLLAQNIHPTIICNGYKLAAEKATKTLTDLSIPIISGDRKTLRNIAMTSLASKNASGLKTLLANIVVDAVTSVTDDVDGKTIVDLDDIQIHKKSGGNIGDIELIKGIVLEKERVHDRMPKHIRKARIALADIALEVQKTEIDAKIEIRDPAQLQSFLDEEESMLRKMVEKVKTSGAAVFITQKGINDFVQHLLAKEGIYAVQQVKREDMEKLAKATRAVIVANFDDLVPMHLGYAGLVEEKKIGEDKMTIISECRNPRAISILIRGSTKHIMDQLERGLRDALFVVKIVLEDGKIVPGGGATQTEVAMTLRDFAPTIGGREQMVIEAFADAVEMIPKILAENSGLNPIDIMIKLRNTHKKGHQNAGINAVQGTVDDMVRKNIIEPLRVNLYEIRVASEAATMILRIDDVVAAKSGDTSSAVGR